MTWQSLAGEGCRNTAKSCTGLDCRPGRLLHLWLTTLAIFMLGCGRLADDVDAGPDATFDLDAHWGECCYELYGGVVGPTCSWRIDV
jgi:hypothetical protein